MNAPANLVVETTSPAFKENAREALADRQLQQALSAVAPGLAARRGAARDALPEFETLREKGRDIKNHTLANLDIYLELFEAKAKAAGSHVHFAPAPQDARDIILDICRKANAKVVTKG
jgi:L-lactate dehydrogenase complex protein LldF